MELDAEGIEGAEEHFINRAINQYQNNTNEEDQYMEVDVEAGDDEITILGQQNADQAMLQNENFKLKEFLVEKESQIQQKATQLQMVPPSNVPQAETDTGFLCEICSKLCNTRKALTTHIASHTKPHKCEKCGKAFAFPNKLEAHRQQKRECTREKTLNRHPRYEE